MSKVLPVPHFQQSREGFCLPACARMLLSYLGSERDEAGIAQILGTKTYGTPSSAIERLGGSHIEVVYQQWSTAELSLMLEAGNPLIAFVRTIFLGYYQEDFAHALVVIESEPDQYFRVQDPAQSTGPTKVSWDGMLAAWAEFDYYGAVLRTWPKD